MKLSANKGFGLIELLVGVTIISLVVGSAFALSTRALQVRDLTTKKVQAALLLNEGAEAMRLVRDSGWATTSALTLNTDYLLQWDGVMWSVMAAAPGSVSLVDGLFDRRFRLSSISRDANHKIVTSGGTVDSDGKLVKMSVSWKPYYGATTTRSTSFYLFNIF